MKKERKLFIKIIITAIVSVALSIAFLFLPVIQFSHTESTTDFSTNDKMQGGSTLNSVVTGTLYPTDSLTPLEYLKSGGKVTISGQKIDLVCKETYNYTKDVGAVILCAIISALCITCIKGFFYYIKGDSWERMYFKHILPLQIAKLFKIGCILFPALDLLCQYLFCIPKGYTCQIDNIFFFFAVIGFYLPTTFVSVILIENARQKFLYRLEEKKGEKK